MLISTNFRPTWCLILVCPLHKKRSCIINANHVSGIHYPLISYAPVVSAGKSSHESFKVSDLTLQCKAPVNQQCSVPTNSPPQALSQTTKWSSVIPGAESTWPSPFSTVEMLYPATALPPLPPSKPKLPSTSSTGAPRVSSSESIFRSHTLSLAVSLLRPTAQLACCQILQLLLKPGPASTTSST